MSIKETTARHYGTADEIWAAAYAAKDPQAGMLWAMGQHAKLEGAYRDSFIAVERAANRFSPGRVPNSERIIAERLEGLRAERFTARRAERAGATVTSIDGKPVTAIAEPFGWLDVKRIFDEPIPEPKWVVPEMEIGPGRPCGLWGLGGGGKSWDAMEIARAVVSGTKAFGHFDVTQGNVSHVSHELGMRAVRERYRRLANGNNMQLEDFGERLRISCLPKLFLNSPGAEDHYCRAFEGQSLVILDSLRRAVPGEDENSSEMSNHLDVMNRVSEKTGAAFLVIHHCGKGEFGDKRLAGRGSTAIMDGSGCIWLLEGGGTGPRLMTQTRAHDDGDGECEPFYVEMVRVALPDAAPVFQANRAPVKLRRLDQSAMGDQAAEAKAKKIVADSQKAENIAIMLIRDGQGKITKGNLEKALVDARCLKQKAARDLIADLVDRKVIAETRGEKNALTYQLVSS